MRGKLNLISLIAGFVLHLLDVGFDIYVAIQYFIRGEWWWGTLTLVFILLPIIIAILVSIYTSPIDTSFHGWIVVKLKDMVTVTLLFVDAIRDWKKENWDIKPCVSNYWHCPCGPCELFCRRKMESAKSTILLALFRLLETLTESAPQWCLQIYVMLRQWYFPWYTILSTIFSFLSLVYGITTYEKARKTYNWYIVNKNRKNYPTPFASYITFFAWQFFVLLSRLSALVIFAYVFRYYVFVALGVHLVVMISKNSYFSNELDNSANGLFDRIKLFRKRFVGSFANMLIPFGRGFRYRKMVFILYHVENILLTSLAVWIAPAGTTHMEDLKIIVLIFVFLGTIGATMFMTLYYCCCHPSEFTELVLTERKEDNTEKPLNQSYTDILRESSV